MILNGVASLEGRQNCLIRTGMEALVWRMGIGIERVVFQTVMKECGRGIIIQLDS